MSPEDEIEKLRREDKEFVEKLVREVKELCSYLGDPVFARAYHFLKMLCPDAELQEDRDYCCYPEIAFVCKKCDKECKVVYRNYIDYDEEEYHEAFVEVAGKYCLTSEEQGVIIYTKEAIEKVIDFNVENLCD